MGRTEVITMICTLTGAANRKKAENHLDYLIRAKLLPKIASGGKVVKAQQTTTKRSCIRVEQQHRWHFLIEFTWEEHARKNQPTEHFKIVRAYFMLNLDETCIMSNAGLLKVIGSADKKKHEKIVDDSRDSITAIRIGSAAGTSGPIIFLAKGKDLTIQVLKNLPKNFDAPPGSKVYMTPNAYLNDETWELIAEDLAAGIRAMPVIQDHSRLVGSTDYGRLQQSSAS